MCGDRVVGVRNVDGKTRWVHPEPTDTFFEEKSEKPLKHRASGRHAVRLLGYGLLMKPGTPLSESARLVDHVRERVRFLHYSQKAD